MAQITLVYDIPLPPTMSVAAFLAKVGAADIDQGELAYLSMSINSDTTAQSGTNARRTVVLDTDATSDVLFPTVEAKQYATRNLYTGALSLKVPGDVTAFTPSVS